jgi:hypothetical protein
MAEKTLREKQSIFLLNAAKLISWAFEQGFELTAGELLRTKDQQTLYFEGKTLVKIGNITHLAETRQLSKTMNSRHLDKLAIDLNLFISGVYTTKAEYYKPMGDYWKTLHPDNVWGGDWGFDSNHFEMKP